ncbi:peptidylprolyl isomerase [Amycolatopsis sp. CA-128772]|uniref:peptidylprolyl isomerase n=1 Tax=Amycolatopsis sp. CA-128772 TaxID=2073159 RepID=UPI000CD026FF|nr:peptidylprolyl isomerase [Amycolatopsis sp. CA-128772]
MSEPGGRPGQYPPWPVPVPPKRSSATAMVLVIGSVVVVVVMVLAFLAFGSPGFLRKPDGQAGGAFWSSSSSSSSPPVAPGPPAAIPGERAPMPKRTRPLADPVTCAFTPDPGPPAPKKAALPPDGPASSTGTAGVQLATTAGDIGLTLDRALAPCTVVNFLSLARQGFYDGTSCHRLSVSTGLQMLQCGDPVGDGTGGPGYTIRDEVFPELTYGRGILAMAKTTAPDSGGSQFFLVFGETNIPPEYTVFGGIDDPGLATLDAIARRGIDPAKPGPGDGSGPPTTPVTITHVTATP